MQKKRDFHNFAASYFIEAVIGAGSRPCDRFNTIKSK